MNILIFHNTPNAAAARLMADLLRQRRHKPLLRDIIASATYGETESADRLIFLLADDEHAPGVEKIIANYKGRLGMVMPDVMTMKPGDPLWDMTDDESKCMNPLNTLRSEAALLGIEVDPAMDAERLTKLIDEARGKEALKLAAEQEALAKAAAEAEEARKTREAADAAAVAAGAAKTAEGGEGAGEAEGGEQAPDAEGEGETPPADETPAANPLEGIDVTDAAALRTFAKDRNIPVSPNPRTGADKLLATIKTALGVE